MRNTVCAFVALLTLSIAAPANAKKPESNIQLRIHSSRPNIDQSMFGISGRIIAPSITSDPRTWILQAGPMMSGHGWHVELLAGAMSSSGLTIPQVAAHTQLKKRLWNFPVQILLITELIIGEESVAGSLFGQVDYVGPLHIAVGLETENVLREEEDTLSVGPHILIPIDALSLDVAYQFHFRDEQNHIWLRAILNL